MYIYILCIIGVFLISMVCGAVSIPLLLNYSKVKKLYDIPDARKIHHSAVSRLGGIAFMPSMFLSFAAALLFLDSNEHLITINLWSLYFLISIMLIYVMGIIDDVFGLTPSTKFLIQIIAACILPLSGLYINNLYGFMGIHEIPYYIGFPLTVLVIVFIDNAINLIDGIDGLAASISVIALGGFLYMFCCQRIWSYAILIAGLIGVLVSFLYFNIFGDAGKNRKIFMGDSGSLTLGFIIGFLCVKYSMDNNLVIQSHKFHFIMTFTMIIVPMFDVVRVFTVRIFHHKSPFVADKSHIHHKFMKAGMTQRQTLVTIILISVFYVLLNKLLLCCLCSTVIFFIDVFVFAAINLVLNRFIRRKGM